MRELVKRSFYSIIIIFIYEIGTHIILPGYLVQAYQSPDFMESISLVTGGNLSRLSFFALGLGPYMSGMIFWRVIQSLNQDRFSKINDDAIYYMKAALILLIAMIQSLGLSVSMKNNITFFSSTELNIILATFVFTTGAMFTMWLVDLNMDAGIGGPSLLILIGILSRLPKITWSFVQETLVNNPTMNSVISFVVVSVGIVLIISIISFVLGSEFRIPVTRIMIRNELAVPTYIPIKLLPANAMPYMFGLTFMAFPQLVMPLLKNWIPFLQGKDVTNLTSLKTASSICLYLIILIILGYGFAFVNVNPSEISENLLKNGDYIVDVLPGDDTREYITHKLMDMATVGNVVTMLLLGIPLFMSLRWEELSSFSYLFGSLLILNTTIVSINDQCRALIEKNHYPSILANKF